MEVGLLALWLPILVSTVLVFLLNFVLYMVLPHHRTDFEGLEDEEWFCTELRSHSLKEGLYAFPYAGSPVDAKDPLYQDRVRTGPVGILAIGRNEISPSPRQLVLQFVYVAMLTTIVAYVAGHALGPGTEYLQVFRIVGATSLLGYAAAVFAFPIWYSFRWSFAVKNALDGVVYSLVTAGVFGWLWPM